MKIVYVLTGLKMGGAENQVCLLADNMFKRGHDITLISLGGEIQVKPQLSGLPIYNLNMDKNPYSFIVSYFKLRSIIRKINPDVVHSHLFHANIICRLLRLTLRVKKLISSSHSRNEGGKMRMLIYRATCPLTNLNTNVSRDAVLESIKQKCTPKRKIKLVTNGIDISKFREINGVREKINQEFNFEKDDILLLAVGRFTEAKDYPTLLQAFKILHSSYARVKLLIVGHGELFSTIDNIRDELELKDIVFFTGIRNDVAELMSACNVYVMSSAWEGLPLVIGEAMACGSLIVTTKCGGVEEILGDCGTIVPVGSPTLLASGIESVLQLNKSERELLKHKSRVRIETMFSIDSVVDQWIKIYSEL